MSAMAQLQTPDDVFNPDADPVHGDAFIVIQKSRFRMSPTGHLAYIFQDTVNCLCCLARSRNNSSKAHHARLDVEAK